jgi:hypothetical protein
MNLLHGDLLDGAVGGMPPDMFPATAGRIVYQDEA